MPKITILIETYTDDDPDNFEGTYEVSGKNLITRLHVGDWYDPANTGTHYEVTGVYISVVGNIQYILNGPVIHGDSKEYEPNQDLLEFGYTYTQHGHPIWDPNKTL